MWLYSSPVAVYKMQASSLNIKGLKECRPLESAIKRAYWEGHLIAHLFYKQGRNEMESNISESEKIKEHLAEKYAIGL